MASWGRCIGDRRLGLLAALILGIAPGLAEHRVEFTLDLPLTGATTLALFTLCHRWQRPGPEGGRWTQAVIASTSITASILIKQSALLVVVLPTIWAGLQALKERKRCIRALLWTWDRHGRDPPWLQHNWITTLGGTQRAVIASAAKEGDPGPLQLESWIWYPRLPRQMGGLVLGSGLAGALLHFFKRKILLSTNQPKE